MMATAGTHNEPHAPRSSKLLDKIKSWDEAMQWSERYVKAEGDVASEQWSPLYELVDLD